MINPYTNKPKKRSTSFKHDFDLNTNYLSIPRYSAIEDKNLVYFLDKAKNRKIIENIRIEQEKKRNKKEVKVQRDGSYTHRNREVSQTDFLHYIQKMKEKAKEKTVAI